MKKAIASANVLILSPHTDDAEMAMGGTISRMVREGHVVSVAAFSAARESVREDLSEDIHHLEFLEAMKSLKVNWEACFEFPVRRFCEHRQEILETMIALKKGRKPDMVFLPSVRDTHQDHRVIAHEGFRVFKTMTMFGYELPWNNLTFTTSAFMEISEEDLKNKIHAIRIYRSQEQKPYVSRGYIAGQARMRGVQIERQFAEAFEAVRVIL